MTKKMTTMRVLISGVLMLASLDLLTPTSSLKQVILPRAAAVRNAKLPASASQVPSRYSITDLGTLYGGMSEANGINAPGHVTGSSTGPVFSNPRGFVYRNNALQDLGTLGGAESQGWSINAFDQVAGYSMLPLSEHAFLWTPGGIDGDPGNPQMRDLGTTCYDPHGASCQNSRAYGINASGQVTGYAATPAGFHAFLWTRGSTGGSLVNPEMLDLGTLGGIDSLGRSVNDAGQVAGMSRLSNGQAHAFRYSAGVMHDLGSLGGDDSQVMSSPMGINAQGDIVGRSFLFGNITSHAFLEDGTGMHDLPTLGGVHSGAQAINDLGVIVGFAEKDGGTTACLWSDGVIYELKTLIPEGSGWDELQEARGINNAGQIAGVGALVNGGGRHAFLLTPEFGGAPLLSIKDSFLRSGADDTNEGANERLRIQNSGDNRVVVGFDLTGVSIAGLQSATLILNIAENSNNWGTTGRVIDAHRLLVDWTEGNGRNDVMVGGGPGSRGTGAGVTWHCGTDTNIFNQIANCSPLWNGGNYAAATAPGVLHSNGFLGQVSWNVTADILAGANFGWMIRKQNEGQNGQVRYYSREGATLAGNANLAPRLVLVYSQ